MVTFQPIHLPDFRYTIHKEREKGHFFPENDKRKVVFILGAFSEVVNVNMGKLQVNNNLNNIAAF